MNTIYCKSVPDFVKHGETGLGMVLHKLVKLVLPFREPIIEEFR